MTMKIVVPGVGESITEGVISAWLKKDGEFVNSGESLYELETDKITTEVPADASGIVKTSVKVGTTVKIGTEIGTIEPGQAPAGASKAAAVATAPAAMPVAMPAAASKVAPVMKTPPVVAAPAPVTAAPTQSFDDSMLPPSARRKLRDGAATAAPVTAPTAQAVTPTPVRGERETRQRMSTLRQRIAERLVASQRERASLTTFNEADMGAIMELREKFKENFKEKHGAPLGMMSFFVRAVVAALKAVPPVNGRIEGNDIIYNNFYDIGIAVSTERGLVVPVLRDADRLSMAEIEKKIADLAVRARENKIGIEELQGGTFTITNGGVFGSLMATPIINPPQSAILGMHTIKKRPVVVNEQIVIRPMMYLALSYDHRIIDGKESVTFLVKVKEWLENPGKALLDIA